MTLRRPVLCGHDTILGSEGGTTSEFYHAGMRALQEKFESRPIADRLVEVTLSDAIGVHDARFIAAADMFFLATSDPEGHPDCSYKGGDPGFVRVLDEHTIAWPDYDGNGMFRSMGNIVKNSKVSLLFIDFEHGRRTRVAGEASINEKDPLMKEFPEAHFIVRVKVDKVWPNCPRYIHQYKLVKRSTFVPRKGCETPIPGWKLAPWANDALPPNDKARQSPAAPSRRAKT